jgi:hypothetical protein
MVKNANQSENTEWRDVFADLSDHYPVYGRFVYHAAATQRRGVLDGAVPQANTQPIVGTAAHQRLTAQVAMDEPQALEMFKPEVFPNPARGQLQVKLPTGVQQVKFEVVSVLGVATVPQVQQGKNAQQWQLDLSQCSPGLYLLRITDNQQRVHSVRFVVK